ncbi:MAG: hypothetical protein WBB28_02080 [Crinalium sp.]
MPEDKELYVVINFSLLSYLSTQSEIESYMVVGGEGEAYVGKEAIAEVAAQILLDEPTHDLNSLKVYRLVPVPESEIKNLIEEKKIKIKKFEDEHEV